MAAKPQGSPAAMSGCIGVVKKAFILHAFGIQEAAQGLGLQAGCMALHKSQAQFARAQWRIKLLAPIWASQLLLTMAMMGLFAWRFGNTMRHHDDKVKAGKKPTIEYAYVQGRSVGML
ncbi:hypothetical protein BM221_008398 [Beauveria bassiana]|uniref:Uncharacterized protein n=1 Tax=Beauveria bassiana TaxID=176275 RepID=A0A2N6NG57_BEABA|nr:hypothetical protein BM221_008398 [Beauveria bassiana]